MKKLEDMYVSTSDIELFIDSKIYGKVGSSLPESTFDKSEAVPDTWDLTRTSLLIGIPCMSGDPAAIKYAFKYLSNYFRTLPDATKMLWHYFTGDGEDVQVSTKLVLDQDPKLRKVIFEKIMNRVELVKESNGSFAVSQMQFGNTNWQYSFGSMSVKWSKINNEVQLRVEDEYKWSPNTTRITRCVHQAMTRAIKIYSAKPFIVSGTLFSID